MAFQEGSIVREIKSILSTKTLVAAVLITFGAATTLTPAVKAQVSINIGIQPVCSYGYYDYAPYGCAPMAFYGSGYFYNGIFLGMGPWAGWGYDHGWGEHRFEGDGGGRYHGGGGQAANRAYASSHAGGGGHVAQRAAKSSEHAQGPRVSRMLQPRSRELSTRPRPGQSSTRWQLAHSNIQQRPMRLLLMPRLPTAAENPIVLADILVAESTTKLKSVEGECAESKNGTANRRSHGSADLLLLGTKRRKTRTPDIKRSKT
jgi:hypothetical protein